jgi:hypothetical protein
MHGFCLKRHLLHLNKAPLDLIDDDAWVFSSNDDATVTVGSVSRLVLLSVLQTLFVLISFLYQMAWHGMAGALCS